jgi:hypothetical protein
MSAKVKNNPLGGWIGHCAECNETIAGDTETVDLWADIHNHYTHQDATA